MKWSLSLAWSVFFLCGASSLGAFAESSEELRNQKKNIINEHKNDPYVLKTLFPSNFDIKGYLSVDEDLREQQATAYLMSDHACVAGVVALFSIKKHLDDTWQPSSFELDRLSELAKKEFLVHWPNLSLAEKKLFCYPLLPYLEDYGWLNAFISEDFSSELANNKLLNQYSKNILFKNSHEDLEMAYVFLSRGEIKLFIDRIERLLKSKGAAQLPDSVVKHYYQLKQDPLSYVTYEFSHNQAVSSQINRDSMGQREKEDVGADYALDPNMDPQLKADLCGGSHNGSVGEKHRNADLDDGLNDCFNEDVVSESQQNQGCETLYEEKNQTAYSLTNVEEVILLHWQNLLAPDLTQKSYDDSCESLMEAIREGTFNPMDDSDFITPFLGYYVLGDVNALLSRSKSLFSGFSFERYNFEANSCLSVVQTKSFDFLAKSDWLSLYGLEDSASSFCEKFKQIMAEKNVTPSSQIYEMIGQVTPIKLKELVALSYLNQDNFLISEGTSKKCEKQEDQKITGQSVESVSTLSHAALSDESYQELCQQLALSQLLSFAQECGYSESVMPYVIDHIKNKKNKKLWAFTYWITGLKQENESLIMAMYEQFSPTMTLCDWEQLMESLKENMNRVLPKAMVEDLLKSKDQTLDNFKRLYSLYKYSAWSDDLTQAESLGLFTHFRGEKEKTGELSDKNDDFLKKWKVDLCLGQGEAWRQYELVQRLKKIPLVRSHYGAAIDQLIKAGEESLRWVPVQGENSSTSLVETKALVKKNAFDVNARWLFTVLSRKLRNAQENTLKLSIEECLYFLAFDQACILLVDNEQNFFDARSLTYGKIALGVRMIRHGKLDVGKALVNETVSHINEQDQELVRFVLSRQVPELKWHEEFPKSIMATLPEMESVKEAYKDERYEEAFNLCLNMQNNLYEKGLIQANRKYFKICQLLASYFSTFL